MFPRFLFTRSKPQNDTEEGISLALRKMDIPVEAKTNVSLPLELTTEKSCLKLFALEQNEFSH